MEKWEYKTVNIEAKGHGGGTLDISNFNMVLNQLGSVGWEMVSCFAANQEVFAVLKRKVGGSMTELADQSQSAPARTHGYAEKGPRTFLKSKGYGEDRGDHPGKGSKYSDKGFGYKGKSSGYEGKASGYKGKSSGYEGKSSGYKGKSSGYGEKGAGYKGKSSGDAGKGFGYKGKGSRV